MQSRVLRQQSGGEQAGTSIFSLNCISVIEDFVICAEGLSRRLRPHPRVKENEEQLCKGMQFLRLSGFQCCGAASVIKDGGSGLSAGLLTAVRKHRLALFPTTKGVGLTPDCRMQWCWTKWAGIGTVGLVNYYGVNGSCMLADTIAMFRAVGKATDGGRQCIAASGDWNISAYDLEESGLLEGFGLAIMWPTNGDVTCTQTAKGPSPRLLRNYQSLLAAGSFF